MNVIYVRTSGNQPPSKGHTFAKLCYKIPRVAALNNTFSYEGPRKYLPRLRSRGFSLKFCNVQAFTEQGHYVILKVYVILTRNIILDMRDSTMINLSNTSTLKQKVKQNSLCTLYTCIFNALCVIICLPQVIFNNLMNFK